MSDRMHIAFALVLAALLRLALWLDGRWTVRGQLALRAHRCLRPIAMEEVRRR